VKQNHYCLEASVENLSYILLSVAEFKSLLYNYKRLKAQRNWLNWLKKCVYLYSGALFNN